MSDAKRMWLMVGVVTVAIVVAVVVYLVVNRPWESRGYKDCVRNAQRQLGNDFSTSVIETYCHELYP